MSEAPVHTDIFLKSIRENLRSNIRTTRIKHRESAIDRLRIRPEDVEMLPVDVISFTNDEIMATAHSIKKRKHITTDELQKLSYAFLQSADNIECFLNVTGALNVLVKESIGRCSNCAYNVD